MLCNNFLNICLSSSSIFLHLFGEGRQAEGSRLGYVYSLMAALQFKPCPKNRNSQYSVKIPCR